MKYILQHIGAIVLVALAGWGCTSPEELSEDHTKPAPVDGDVTIYMTLQIPGTSSGTRTLTETQESKVNLVDILVFDDVAPYKLIDWQYGQVEPGTNNFSTKLQASKDATDKFRIMALANVRNRTYELFGNRKFEETHKGVTSYADVCALLVNAVPTYEELSEGGLPMWGELENPVQIDKDHTNHSMTLLRSLARIDVGTNPNPTFKPTGQIEGWQKLSNFELTDVIVYNASTNYALTARQNYDFGTQRVADYTLPTTNPKAAEQTNTLGVGEKHLLSTIYVGENNVKVTPTGTYGDANHLNRMSLVVGGKYNGATAKSYYRIDFNNGAQLQDVLRNNDYQFIITSVNGPGSTKPSDAIEKVNADMVVVVNTWNKGSDTYTVVDGQNWLTVSRQDITTDKWGKTIGDLVITTNISRWNARIAAGGNWLSLPDASPGGDDSGASGDLLPFTVTRIPNTPGGERTGRIRINAGIMEFDVMVKQTNTDSEFMLRISAANFTFHGRSWNEAEQKWEAPAPQTLTVDWAPRANDFMMDLKPYTGSGITGFNPPATTDNPTVSITPEMIAPDDPRVVADPFFERSSILTLTAQNIDGSITMQKQVTVKQIFHSLNVTSISVDPYTGRRMPVEDYYFLGKNYSWIVSSNSSWVIDVENGENVFSQVPTWSDTNGYYNRNVRTVDFTISPTAAPNAEAKITFRSPQNLFPPQTITVVAQEELPNSYMVKPGNTQSLPVHKAYRVWKYDRDLKTDLSTLPGARGAHLVWQDTPGLIKTVVYGNNGGENDIIDVQTEPGKTGNALVAFTIGGEIYWSWHIWVTDYNPEAQNVTWFDGATLMDRNLGALGNDPANANIVGTYYHTGRKDPIPAPRTNGADRWTTYDIFGNPLPRVSGNGARYSVYAPGQNNMANSIKNPTTNYADNYGSGAWTGQEQNGRPYMWGYYNTAEGAVRKGDYDPCPAGWSAMYSGTLTSYGTACPPRTTHPVSNVVYFDFGDKGIVPDGGYVLGVGHTGYSYAGYGFVHANGSTGMGAYRPGQTVWWGAGNASCYSPQMRCQRTL